MVLLLLGLWGVGVGLLAGLFGIGGGVVMVPLLVSLGYTGIQAVATSSLAIVITATAGTWQNWQQGVLPPQTILALGLPALVTSQIGVWLAHHLGDKPLLISFSLFLWLNLYLMGLRKRLASPDADNSDPQPIPNQTPKRLSKPLAQTLTGGLAGILAGLFGIGGGVFLVPFQMLLLGEPIKPAIQISLGVVCLTAIATTLGHGLQGQFPGVGGLALGLGGLLGVQVTTRLLPKLNDRWVNLGFRGLLIALSLSLLGQALQLP